MTWGNVLQSAGWQRGTIVYALGKRVGRQLATMGGCQFDRQGHTVKLLADRGDVGQCAGVI
ncbi:MAG: hypothetical protein M9909_01770 [Thermomicrobiales bacterium]|nr:hypothetical protein [Thermomicrobiales bacterium]